MTKEMAIHNLYALKQRTRALSDHEALDMAIKALEQQPKTGKWIGCSICNRCNYKKMSLWRYNYCPNCGADMRESEE